MCIKSLICTYILSSTACWQSVHIHMCQYDRCFYEVSNRDFSTASFSRNQKMHRITVDHNERKPEPGTLCFNMLYSTQACVTCEIEQPQSLSKNNQVVCTCLSPPDSTKYSTLQLPLFWHKKENYTVNFLITGLLNSSLVQS